MKQKVGPVAVIIAVVFLVGFMYFMYKRSQPNLQADYDPRNGPPAYATRGQGQGGAPPGGYQRPGQQPGAGQPGSAPK